MRLSEKLYSFWDISSLFLDQNCIYAVFSYPLKNTQLALVSNFSFLDTKIISYSNSIRKKRSDRGPLLSTPDIHYFVKIFQ